MMWHRLVCRHNTSPPRRRPKLGACQTPPEPIRSTKTTQLHTTNVARSTLQSLLRWSDDSWACSSPRQRLHEPRPAQAWKAWPSDSGRCALPWVLWSSCRRCSRRMEQACVPCSSPRRRLVLSPPLGAHVPQALRPRTRPLRKCWGLLWCRWSEDISEVVTPFCYGLSRIAIFCGKSSSYFMVIELYDFLHFIRFLWKIGSVTTPGMIVYCTLMALILKSAASTSATSLRSSGPVVWGGRWQQA